MRTGRFTGPVPEEWREYRALQTGTVAPRPFDEQSWIKTELFVEFAAIEHELAKKRAARERRR